MINRINDPITGDRLEIYGSSIPDNEVYRCNIPKITASLVGNLQITEDEAVRLLANSDIENPISLNDEIFWAE